MQKFIKIISINIFDNGSSECIEVGKVINLKDFKGYQKSERKKHKKSIYFNFKNLFK